MEHNLNHLLVFDAVARSGSITGGAKSLMVSQPAVSKQLKLLQRALRAKLLERRG
jgi:DNA-binding transcriptional LysR family regulator